MKKQDEFARGQSTLANEKYSAYFDNDLYIRAIENRQPRYANALLDEALALCGNPYYKLSHRHWSEEAVAFLERFRWHGTL